jgi:hypothetical protein
VTDCAEHLEWCKSRALEYLEQGDLLQAHASMISDLSKHPETLLLIEPRSLAGSLLFVIHHDKEGLRDWINDL